jgi:hypothetical protein
LASFLIQWISTTHPVDQKTGQWIRKIEKSVLDARPQCGRWCVVAQTERPVEHMVRGMNERACSGLKSLAVGVSALILGGCAFGRPYSDGSAPVVTSSDKPQRFDGLIRGGFGNPLAVEIRYAMSKAVDVTAPSGSG